MPSTDDDVEQYWMIRRAVRDGIWDVIGTVLTVGVAGLLLFVGLAIASRGAFGDAGGRSLLTVAFGAVLVLGAVVVFLREFDIYPFD